MSRMPVSLSQDCSGFRKAIFLNPNLRVIQERCGRHMHTYSCVCQDFPQRAFCFVIAWHVTQWPHGLFIPQALLALYVTSIGAPRSGSPLSIVLELLTLSAIGRYVTDRYRPGE